MARIFRKSNFIRLKMEKQNLVYATFFTICFNLRFLLRSRTVKIRNKRIPFLFEIFEEKAKRYDFIAAFTKIQMRSSL